MGCTNCGKGSNPPVIFDRHGNKMVNPDAQVSPEHLHNEPISFEGKPVHDMNFDELIEDKNNRRMYQKKAIDDLLKNSTKDLKRLMLVELIDIYNMDEIYSTKLSPDQALVTLYEYVRHPEFADLISEFPGLKEDVDSKYSELKSKRISAKFSGAK